MLLSRLAGLLRGGQATTDFKGFDDTENTGLADSKQCSVAGYRKTSVTCTLPLTWVSSEHRLWSVLTAWAKVHIQITAKASMSFNGDCEAATRFAA